MYAPKKGREAELLAPGEVVRHERRGRTRVYTVDKARLALVSEWLAWFEAPPGASEG